MAEWQLEMGARVLDDGRVRFRVYAPAARTVEVESYPLGEGISIHPMSRDDAGLWSAELDAWMGALYRYRLDNTLGYPDPYSRSQPEGVHGPSRVTDPAFGWTDAEWRGLEQDALVIYELHVGAYTAKGTFDAVISHLDDLQSLGITAIELMPVCEFPGIRNWGYDGAHRFAPESSYGGPDGLRRLVSASHAAGVGVILDVVYNHLAPDGDYLGMFVPDVVTDRYYSPWGKAINFDGPGSAFVRQYFIDNLLYWMYEFHIDGFRLDAAHEIYDSSEPHILRELAEAVHAKAPAGKDCVIIAEHGRHETRVVARTTAGGHGLDAMWVDDFHHSIYVRLTGEKDLYHDAYNGSMDELVRLLNGGLLYQDATGLDGATAAEQSPPQALVYCLQNHDQIGNRQFGTRLTEIVGLEMYKAAYALLLLVPETPLLFMGDECAASTPFMYFVDHNSELAILTTEGREAAFGGFWAAGADDDRRSPDAQAESSMMASKLDWSERERAPHDGVLRMFREVIALRQQGASFRGAACSFRAEAASDDTLLIERQCDDDWQLAALNFGDVAPLGREGRWRPILSTAERRFDGPGLELESLYIRPDEAITLPARSTTVWRRDSSQD